MILPSAALAANFTRGTGTATKFGVHEISLTGNGGVSNPYDTIATVTFTPPSGSSNAVTVHAFYDGGNNWRARVYVSETGNWTWTSSSSDSGLNSKNGSFSASSSDLRGKLKKNPSDNKAWATDDGKWFLNTSDTAYYLFNSASTNWQQFVSDDWALGITSLRCNLVGALRHVDKQQSSDGWDRIFASSSHNTMNAAAFQLQDTRMEWMLNNHPDIYIQLITTPEPSNGYGNDESLWHGLSTTQRTRFMRYVVARYAAWPQIFWLVTNDAFHGSAFPKNNAMVNEIGNYLADNDPWKDKNLRSSGRNRDQSFYFLNESWVSYIHLETTTALSADQAATYASSPMHVFDGEDWYESTKTIPNDAYFFRRLFWSWTLSGGSSNYGGYWNQIQPYDNTSFTGLNDIPHLYNFFDANGISLAGLISNDAKATGPSGTKRVKLMRKSNDSAILFYHPNAAVDGGNAALATGAAICTLTNLAAGSYSLRWLRAEDGAVVDAPNFTHSGGNKTLTAPWSGKDVVAWLQSPPGGGSTPPPSSEYQAESAATLSGVTTSTANAGYTGGGYADYGSAGTYVEWTNINAASAGTGTLGLRYATNSDRPCQVHVNGNLVGTLDFTSTGTWTNWQIETIDVPLTAGNNTVRVTAIGAGPNIDRLDVSVSAPSIIEYQAESATWWGVTIGTANAGYTGSGYADYGSAGTFVQWNTVNAPSAGTRTLGFRYATNSNRPCQVHVNGVLVGTLACASTGDWDNWQIETMNVPLNAGANTVRVTAVGAGPNIDRLDRH